MARSSEAVRATGRIIVGLFSYEVFALATGTVPTLTELCRRYRWVEATILAVWLTHVHRKIVEQAVEEAAANLGEQNVCRQQLGAALCGCRRKLQRCPVSPGARGICRRLPRSDDERKFDR